MALKNGSNLLKAHTQLVYNFISHTKPEPLASDGVSDTTRKLLDNFNLIEHLDQGPEVDQLSQITRQLVRKGLLLIKSYKSNNTIDSEALNDFKQTIQEWKKDFINVRGMLDNKVHLMHNNDKVSSNNKKIIPKKDNNIKLTPVEDLEHVNTTIDVISPAQENLNHKRIAQITKTDSKSNFQVSQQTPPRKMLPQRKAYYKPSVKNISSSNSDEPTIKGNKQQKQNRRYTKLLDIDLQELENDLDINLNEDINFKLKNQKLENASQENLRPQSIMLDKALFQELNGLEKIMENDPSISIPYNNTHPKITKNRDESFPFKRPRANATVRLPRPLIDYDKRTVEFEQEKKIPRSFTDFSKKKLHTKIWKRAVTPRKLELDLASPSKPKLSNARPIEHHNNKFKRRGSWENIKKALGLDEIDEIIDDFAESIEIDKKNKINQNGISTTTTTTTTDVNDISALKQKLALLESQVGDSILQDLGASIEDHLEPTNDDFIYVNHHPTEYDFDLTEVDDRRKLDYDPLGEEWANSQYRLLDIDESRDRIDTDLELIGVSSPAELAAMSVEELEMRIAALEKEFEEKELLDELNRMAHMSNIIVSEKDLIEIYEGQEPGVAIVDPQEVVEIMNNLKNTTSTPEQQLEYIIKLCKLAQADSNVIEIMAGEGLIEMLPMFFRTKGPLFLIQICNIISTVSLKSPLRLKLCNSQMITFLLETYKTPHLLLTKASENSLIQLSLQNSTLPLILRFLTSDDKNFSGKAKHKLKQTHVMFDIVSNSNDSSQLSTATTTTPLEFLEKATQGQLSPTIFLGLTDDQLHNFMTFVIMDCKKSKPSKIAKNSSALLQRVQLSPLLGTYFYWVGESCGIFKTKKEEGEMSVFCHAKELEDTQTFFQRFQRYWDKLEPGYSKKDLGLIDPITGKIIKKIEVTQRLNNVPLTPLLLTIHYHHTEDKKFMILKKGMDIKGPSTYVQTILNVMNTIWEDSKVQPKPKVKTYRCVPIDKKFGAIEIFEPVDNLKMFDWSLLKTAPESLKMQLLGSFAAAITAAWVLGYKDRIENYMFIHDNQILCSSIYPSNLWSPKPFPNDFLIKLKPHFIAFNGAFGWSFFQNLCSEAFKALHEKGPIIQYVCGTLYRDMYDSDSIEAFISNKSLMLNSSQAEAQQQFVEAIFEDNSLSSKIGKVFKRK